MCVCVCVCVCACVCVVCACVHFNSAVCPQSKFVETSLCLEGVADYSCLAVFSVVVNCAAFYQFIEEEQFVGEEGQALFHQQYQLTAQLQHEEYDDNVLSQLKAAFVFMTPFMDCKQSLRELMTQVTQLNTTLGLKQLEIVNENVILVQQWFSHSEVSHSSSSSSSCFTSFSFCSSSISLLPSDAVVCRGYWTCYTILA